MTERYESERREFVRVRTDLSVRYRFLSKTIEVTDEIHAGTTSDVSGGGLLLVGRIPNPSWYVGLLTQQIVVGVNLTLPSAPEPIKALCRVAWIEAAEGESGRTAMGLKFREISRDSLDQVFQYVIKAQLK